jgi:uncharacterized protein GlcG (DUF336 family)
MTMSVSDSNGQTGTRAVISATGAKEVLRAAEAKAAELAQAMDGAPATLASVMAQPHATLAPAGYPLVIAGVVVGAVGASGGTPDQDQVVAQAGVAALGEA